MSNSFQGREQVKFLVLAASLREESLNVKLARLAAKYIEQHGGIVDFALVEEFDMPFYSQDVETQSGISEGATQLRERLEASDAFIIASPEYNASMPGVLKNAIDWVSRFRPQPFNGRHGLLMSASPSMVGGNRGLWALRIPLEHLGASIYPDMFSLAQAHNALDSQGQLIGEHLATRFEQTLVSFMDLVEAAKHYPCIKKRWVEFLGERTDSFTERVE
jgi:chromate reductase, NAD(P)H dehydrogenase (quinone)